MKENLVKFLTKISNVQLLYSSKLQYEMILKISTLFIFLVSLFLNYGENCLNFKEMTNFVKNQILNAFKSR